MGIHLSEASGSTIAELAWFCVPPERRGDPVFRRGAHAKEAWIQERLARGEPVAKVAYVEGEAAGILHYEPVPEEGAVHILCLYVPHERHWGKGIGSSLLATLVEEMRSPQAWNGGQPARGIATRTFAGHHPGQLPAREFFRRRGFEPVGEDPDFLFLPLQMGARHEPRRSPLAYVPQAEDTDQVIILHGPSFCPWTYPFLVLAAQAIAEIAPHLPIRWIDRVSTPHEAAARGGYEGVVVNGRPIRSFVLDREEFEGEVRCALRG
ncbi:MAG: hypothetical protein Kow0097_10510 [Candidatus Bipolaricaulota bacterium]|nr:GNAT family N-acetyltransferase [Candidatus Bipolaricaulota bacterium]